MKFCKIVLSVITSASFIFTGLVTKADTETPIVYEATVQNGTTLQGDREECTFADGTAKLNFRYGNISVVTAPSPDMDGTTANALPINGTKFLFSYIFYPSTGKVDLGVDGEIVASGTCSNNKGKSSFSTDWYTKYTKVGPTLSGAGIKTISSQSVSVSACDTSMVRLKFTRPIPYSEISKLSVKDSSGNSIAINDYTKSCYEVILNTASLLTKNAQYTITGSNVADIYGGTSSVGVSFRPTAAGSVKTGADVALNKNVTRAWGFERRVDWYEETKLTADHNWSIANTVIGTDNNQEFFDRLYKMKLSTEHAKDGYALKWYNHPYYPTVATNVVAKDWTGANTFNIWMYSEKATGETVNILVYSDNPNTTWHDGYTYPIKVDWVGAKEFSIPLNDFERFENPVGFNNVSSIYFTTKIYNNQPSPDTVLYLDDISVTYDSAYPITVTPSNRVTAENIHRGMPYNDTYLNHSGDEVKTDATTPFDYVAYNKTERALYGYLPKYMPGLTSFDKDGKLYMRADATHIQYLDASGKWQVINLDDEMVSYQRIWDGGTTDEPVIRFDNDGWAYILVTTEQGSVLLWSTDGMKTWQKHLFPLINFSARFEHIEGNNLDAMKRPPLVLLHPQESSSNQNGVLIIPTKSGTSLNFHQVTYADSCITTAAHTGDGNFVISSGNYAYVVYTIYNWSSLKNPDETIPSNHPALSMSYDRDGTTLYYKNGCPTFVRKISLSDYSMSDPVFVGFGGVEDDNHNWAGISIDSKGYLHVIMNGHHDPTAYVVSKKPYDITSWGDIELLGTYNSYGAMLIDKNDTVHIMTRDASRGYRFDTSIMTKTTTGDWTKDYILRRVAPYYEVARQRMSYNPNTNDLWVHYYSQSDYFEVFQDEYEGILFTWPNEERNMLTATINGGFGVIPQNTDRMSNKTKCYWSLDDAGNGREGVLIKSTDGGRTFKLAKTDDCK